MDPITHAALGAGLAALAAPRAQRRLALVLGAVAAVVPDLDLLALAFEPDPVMRLTGHRSASHSLVVLPFVGMLMFWLARLRWRALAEAPWRWLLAFELALLSHPLLDAATVYGTQLWWPLTSAPVMGGNLFIIDPFFALPLLVGVVLAYRRASRAGQGTRPLVFGLALAGAYCAWTLLAQQQIEGAVRARLDARNLTASRVLVTPAPLNSVLWRVLVSDPEGHAEGYYSYWWREGRLSLQPSPRAVGLERELSDDPAVARLNWFTHGFGALDEDAQHRIVYTDLRMGAEPDYVFRYVVADRKDGKLVPRSPPEQLPWPGFAEELDQATRVWRRIFTPG